MKVTKPKPPYLDKRLNSEWETGFGLAMRGYRVSRECTTPGLAEGNKAGLAYRTSLYRGEAS